MRSTQLRLDKIFEDVISDLIFLSDMLFKLLLSILNLFDLMASELSSYLNGNIHLFLDTSQALFFYARIPSL